MIIYPPGRGTFILIEQVILIISALQGVNSL